MPPTVRWKGTAAQPLSFSDTLHKRTLNQINKCRPKGHCRVSCPRMSHPARTSSAHASTVNAPLPFLTSRLLLVSSIEPNCEIILGF
ncbi:hypothetical protein CEXT_188811 [Caerostris extrusa]|uniref:Uncharacterized protein n=1 Tax=Caerostris extrusa TaxID=172846 RepID=A0AAV4NMY5_CAEEX|nr:hypothetical protein CEXT_188811 [Caerostris extrusa]